MCVLGIDPGTAATGYGVVERRGAKTVAIDGGVIATESGLALEMRLVQIHERIVELLEEHQPEAVAIEEIYFGQNVQTAFAVGQARGVVLLAAGAHGIPCFSYTPQAIKSGVCGSGNAPKEQVQKMVQMLLNLPEVPASDHAADALAVALRHTNAAPLLASAAQ